MNKDPKNDKAFQRILERIVAEAFMRLSNEVVETSHERRLLIKQLIDLRFDFVFAAWTSRDPKKHEAKKALANLNSLRNTQEAQVFLNENPYYFTEIDRAFFRDMKQVALDRIAGRI